MKIYADMTILKQDISYFTNQWGQLEQAGERLTAPAEVLGQIWAGEGYDTFDKSYREQLAEVAVCQEVTVQLVTHMQEMMERYQACENQAGDLIGNFRI